MNINIAKLWDCISKLKPTETFTSKQLVRKFSIENPDSVSPILTQLYRMGVLNQTGRQGRSMIWTRSGKQWQAGMKLIRLAVSPGHKRGKRNVKQGKAAVVVMNGSINATIEIHTERFAVLDSVRDWLKSEGVEYTMQIVK